MNRRAENPKPAVILNGVSPWAQAGAKRSEGSLTETRAEAVGESDTVRPACAGGAHARTRRTAGTDCATLPPAPAAKLRSG